MDATIHAVTVETAAARVAGGNRQRFTLDDVEKTYKRRDAWWTVLLVDPVASRLTLPLANRTGITPNQVSAASFAVGLLSAAAFAQGEHPMLVAGALLYHVSFVLDCIDGKIARLKGTGTAFGMWLDFSFDRYKFWICAAALAYGQYRLTEDVRFVWLALFVTFFDMLRYLNAWQVAKVRREMDRRMRAASRNEQRRIRSMGATYVVHGDQHVRYLPHEAVQDAGYFPVPSTMDGDPAHYERPTQPTMDVHRSFFARFGWWPRMRDAVMRHRIRPHLFSGIEYQMFIFVVGPLFNAVVPFVLVSAALLLLFEVALVYKLLLSSRDFDRLMRRASPSAAAAAAEVTAAATAAGAPGAGQVVEAPSTRAT